MIQLEYWSLVKPNCEKTTGENQLSLLLLEYLSAFGLVCLEIVRGEKNHPPFFYRLPYISNP